MPVIMLMCNYHRKHNEVLLGRLVGTRPTPSSPGPLQRRHQSQTWVILLGTELPLVNSGVWGMSWPTDDDHAGESQSAALQNVLGSFSLSGGFNYLGWSSAACFVIIKAREHKPSLQPGTAVQSLLRSRRGSKGSLTSFLFCDRNDSHLGLHTKLWMANPILSGMHLWPSDRGTAFLLWLEQLSPCSAHTRPALQRPRAKLPEGTSLRCSRRWSRFYRSTIYRWSVNCTTRKGICKWVRTLTIWALPPVLWVWGWTTLAPPSHSWAHHGYSFRPAVSFQKLP